MTSRLWRLWPLILLLVLGLAGAQDASKLPECALPAGSAVANPNGSNLTLTAFLPNAPCNMAQITYFWGYWGLWKGMALVGMGLTAALFFWSLFQAILSKTPEKALVPFVIAVVLAGGVMVPATKDQGVLPMVQSTGMEMFNSLYRVSANVGYAAMSQGDSSVQARTAVLGRNLALLVARAQHASTIRAQMQQIKAGKLTGDLADPNLANTLYAEQVRNEQAGANALFSNGGWIFNVGYWILYGLFAVFASIIVVTGFVMQLGMLLLPVLLSFLVLRQFQPLKNFGLAYLGSMATIAILPIVIASMASLAISIPASRMLPVVTQINGDVAAQLTRYQELLRTGCQWYEVSCSFESQVFNPILSDLTTVKEIFTNLVLALLAGMVGLGIATTVSRRLPASVATLFSAVGAGGESSGVETGGLGKLLAMTGGMRMMQQLATRGAGQAVANGARSGGTPTPPTAGSGGSPTPGSGGPSGGGAQYTPPPSVTAGTGPGPSGASTGSSGNVPPTSVTGSASGPQTVVGSGYAAFQASRGAGGSVGQAARAGAGPAVASVQAGVQAYGQRVRQDYSAAAQRGQEAVTQGAASFAFGSANAEQGRAAVGAVVQDARAIRADLQARDQAAGRPVNPDEFETGMPRAAAAQVSTSGSAPAAPAGTPQVARPPQATAAPAGSTPAAGPVTPTPVASGGAVPRRNVQAASGAGGRPIPGVSPSTAAPAKPVPASPATGPATSPTGAVAAPSGPAPAPTGPASAPASPATGPAATSPGAAAAPSGPATTPARPAAAPARPVPAPARPVPAPAAQLPAQAQASSAAQGAPVARPVVARPPQAQNVTPPVPATPDEDDEPRS